MTPIEWATWLIAVFYVIAFLLLSVQASKEAGRSIWLFGHGTNDQRVPALLFRLAFAGAVIWSPIVIVFSISGRLAILPEIAVVDVAGNVMAAIGAAIALASQVYMGRSWRIGAAEGEVGAIVETGPFALSRNPVFVGQILLFVGLTIAVSDVVHLALLTIVIAAIYRQVLIEENVLARSIGEPYLSYRSRVRRWL